MNEVHWSDPEFQEWEQNQVGAYWEHPMTLHGEPLTFFRCDRVHPTGSANFAGPIVSFRIDIAGEPDTSKDAMEVELSRVPEDELKDAMW